jgi:hypothetical protein
VWRADATTPGARQASAFTIPAAMNDAVAAQGKYFFGRGEDVWSSDGTPEGTAVFTQYAAGDLAVLDDVVYSGISTVLLRVERGDRRILGPRPRTSP